ncbi:MAG: hypothetical protein WC304_00875 [Candidatus Gracilibacteria bacterium]
MGFSEKSRYRAGNRNPERWKLKALLIATALFFGNVQEAGTAQEIKTPVKKQPTPIYSPLLESTPSLPQGLRNELGKILSLTR